MADLVSFEPATGAPLWHGRTGDVEAEVAAARAGWTGWAARPLPYRIETLRRFANVVRARHEAFADLLARETGTPLWEARAEIDGCIARVDASVSGYAERTAQRRLDSPMGGRTALRHRPHGVLGVIAPACQPVGIIAGHVIPALIAGNAVVVKPSHKTPAAAAMLATCLHEAGVPEENLRLVHGGAAEGRALAAHPDLDGLFFTGSARVGAILHRAAADRPDRLLALEMGGNNAILAWDTPDVATAAAIVVQSAFASAGQRGTAAGRLVVGEDLAVPLVEEIARLADRLIVGAPHEDPPPFMGPVIDDAAADGLIDGFLDLILRGGRAIRHLGRLDPDRPFLRPAIIDVTGIAEQNVTGVAGQNVTGVAGGRDVPLFGPVLQVVRVASFEEGIAEVNATRFGLSATLLSQTPALYDRFWAGARAGIVNWNRPSHGAGPGAPVGGTGWSGNHRPGGFYAADRCAYPVVSSEAETARAALGIGLRDR
ncbi:MAG: aldehyde dehydrogenase family protein [Janthinobacterium lividum]